MSEPHLLVEKEGHIVTVTFNRSKSRNAFSLEMMARMADAWKMIEEDPEVRVAIMTGADGVFSAGADLKVMHSDQSDNPWHARFREDPDLHWKALLRMRRLSKPLIAAVEGIAFGGGTEVLQGADIRIAGAGARFGVTEARWGLFPLGGSTVRLQRQISYTKACEMLLMARPIDAEEALKIGLIGRIVPDGEVLAEARKCAEVVASNGPFAVQSILRSIRETADIPETEGLAKELEIGWAVLKSKDAREGARAFSEKRPANFTGE